MPSCNNIVYWHFAAVKIGVIVVVVVVLASDIVVIDALKRFVVLWLSECHSKNVKSGCFFWLSFRRKKNASASISKTYGNKTIRNSD